MRRGRRLLAALALLAPGCGEASSAAAAAIEARRGELDRPVEVLAEDAGGRTVRHALGLARVPARPRRILSLDVDLTDCLILLGERPIATPRYGGGLAGELLDYQRPYLDGVVGLAAGSGPEAWLALAPDLILTGGGGATSLALLEQIAPTVVVGSPDPRRRLLDVAAALGQGARARARLAEHDARVAEARRLLAPEAAAGTVAILRLHLKQYRLYGDRMQGAAVFHELGFRPCDYVRRAVLAPRLDRLWLSEEQLAEIDADHLFLFVDPPARARTLELLRRSPVWASLPAVRAGHVHLGSTGFVTATVLGRERVVDDLLAAFGKERVVGR